MKKILLLFVAVLLTSCSNDDVNIPDPNKEDLIGKWKIESTSIEGIELDLDACDLKQEIEFRSDELIITGSYYRDEFLEEDCFVFSNDHGYKLEGKTIDIEYDGGNIFYYGRFLDDNKIQIRTRLNGNTTIRIYTKI